LANNLLSLGSIFNNIIYCFKIMVYGIYMLIAQVCDWIEILFKAFCGLINVSGDSNAINFDPATIILSNSTIRTIFTSMLILGGVVLFITTFIAVIKTEFVGFSEKGQNSKAQVFGYVGRALVNLVAVPVCVLLGVIMANVILRAFYNILNRGTNATLATQTFVCMSYDANRARNSAEFVEAYNKGYNTFGVLNETNFPGYEYADMIDAAFLNNLEFADIGSSSYQVSDNADKAASASNGVYIYYQEDTWTHNQKAYQKDVNRKNFTRSFTIYDLQTVVVFYDLREFNLLVGIVACILVAYNMFMMILGLIKRLFEIGLYYVICPPIIAMYPIDKGEGTKLWRTRMLSAILSAYGGVIAMNVFLMLLPIVLDIDFVSVLNFPTFIAGAIRYFIRVLIVITGVTFMKQASVEFQKMILGKEAGAGALGDGAGAMKGVMKTLGNVARIGAAAAGAGIHATLGTAKFVGQGLNALAGGKEAKEAFKRGTMNTLNKGMNNLTRLGGQIGAAITGKAYDPSKHSKTQITDALNFFKTGTANKEAQNAILSMQNRIKNHDNNAEILGEDVARRNQRLQELNKKKDKGSLSTEEEAELKKLKIENFNAFRENNAKDASELSTGMVYDSKTGMVRGMDSEELTDFYSKKGIDVSDITDGSVGDLRDDDPRKKAYMNIRREKTYEADKAAMGGLGKTGLGRFIALRAANRATGDGQYAENADGKARQIAQYTHDLMIRHRGDNIR